MKTLVLYWSYTGNTEAIAKTICNTVKEEGYPCGLFKIGSESDVDWFDYNLIFVGSPVYQFLPSKNVMKYMQDKFHYYRDKKGYLKPSSPKLKDKFVIAFCTYGGPHTGIHEAIPAIKYIEQFFEHLGFFILEPIAVIGSFRVEKLAGKFGHESKEYWEKMNTSGRLGDITGRPNENDLSDVKNKTIGIINTIKEILIE
jgi:flavorubredoxin